MFTIEDQIDAKCAWKILKEIETLQHLLLQRYHYEFIEMLKWEEIDIECNENLPF